MAVTLGDDTFRPLLRDDMLDAWSLLQVHYDPPQTPGSLSVLPRGFLQLQNIEPGDPRGYTTRVLFHTYRIVGQFPYPDEGTLEEEKVDRFNEILALLTAGDSIYTRDAVDWRYRIDGFDFEVSRTQDDSTERYYSVQLDFSLEWVTGV